MPTYLFDTPTFFEDLTSESMRWYLDVFRDFGNEGSRYVLSDDPSDVDAPCVAILKLPPGDRILRHAHECPTFTVVVKGELEISDGRILRCGDVDIHGRGEFYGPSTAGPEGVVIYEFLAHSRPNPLVAEAGADAETLAYIERVQNSESRARDAADAPRSGA